MPGPTDLRNALLIVRLRDHALPDLPGPLLGLVRREVSGYDVLRLPFRLRLRRAAGLATTPILYAELRAHAGRRLRPGDWFTTSRVAWRPGTRALLSLDQVSA